MNDALISLKPQYAEKILQGCKTAELRTRAVNLVAGSRLWIYSTIPRARIEVVTVVVSTHSGTPEEIWKKYSKQICINKNEFDAYVQGYEKVYVILMSCPKRLSPAPDLNYLRSIIGGFHPPQFIKKLSGENPLSKYLLSLTTCNI